jgi:hypothetical protein
LPKVPNVTAILPSKQTCSAIAQRTKRRQSFTVKRLAAFIVIAACRVFSLPTLHVAFVGEKSRNSNSGNSARD